MSRQGIHHRGLCHIRPLAALLLGALPLWAQDAPPANGNAPLVADAGNDYFERGRNLHDAARTVADEAQRRQMLMRAIDVFNGYLKDFGNHPNAQKAWWYLGSCYQQAGMSRDARRAFGTLIDRFGKGPWVAAGVYAMAADYFNQREYALAGPLFERYAQNAEKAQEKARGLYLAGNCYRLQGGNDARATGVFQQVMADPEAGPFAAQARIGLGLIAASQGRDQEAFDRFLEVLEMSCAEDVKGDALLQAALTARKLGKHEVAGHYLERVVRSEAMKPQWPAARSALMANYFEQGEFQKVIDMAGQEEGKLQGEQEAARRMLVGRAQMRLGKPQEAMLIFRSVERLVAPDSDAAFDASFYRLLCFFQTEGNHVPDQVDAFLEIYQNKRPKDARIHTALMMKAEALHSAGNIGAAALAFSQVDEKLVSDANRPGLLYQRGWCLAEAGDQAGALRSLNQFIESYPKDDRIISALAKRAKVHQQGGRSVEALADYDRLIQAGKPPEMLLFGWLESARLCRADNRLADMIKRYSGLLELPSLEANLKAEAHYWIGWAMVKDNQARQSIPHLEKARDLRGDLYRKHSGVLLALGYFAAQDQPKLAKEIALAIEGAYHADLPDQAIQWSGMQSYNEGKYKQAASFLNLIANPKEPRETTKEVWRYLGKSLLEEGKAEEALQAINNVLAVEDNPAWQADGLLDRGKALLKLDKVADARAAVDQALALQPQGRTRGALRILAGDLDMKDGDAKKASAQYLIVISFVDDKDLKPLALSKLASAQESMGEQAEAAKYRQQLKAEFPDWKAP
ncbi:MAG TPA: tetratricopeptide repeat protein [Luteolibacter sp.]|nr:tetratricopeptide repeat protein [Luteolibacter sp.]